MNTDCDKTLFALIDAGDKGVHSFALNGIVGTNYSPRRIYDLKKKGYVITSIPEKLGNAIGCRYFLQSKPIKEQPKQKEYRFDPEKQVYIYG